MSPLVRTPAAAVKLDAVAPPISTPFLFHLKLSPAIKPAPLNVIGSVEHIVSVPPRVLIDGVRTDSTVIVIAFVVIGVKSQETPSNEE